MKRKNITLLFGHFEKEHIGKDVFLIPYYLGKRNEGDVSIVYPLTNTNKDFPEIIRGVKLIPLSFNRRTEAPALCKELTLFWYLIKNARKIDVLILFHYTRQTVVMTSLYKWKNPKGSVYVKADIDAEKIAGNLIDHRDLKSIVQKKIYRNFTRRVDCFSCETSLAYDKIMKSSSYIWDLKSKLLLLPNGFDEELLMKFGIKENSFDEKENLIITVGRLGTEPKNTEMFLKALEDADLQHWKVCLIGPIEEGFEEIIQNFYERFPEKKNSVIFVGPIYDKKELWEYYNKAKVFVLTSRYESYGLVLNEAKRFRNYLLSTNVGAFSDLSENGKYGMSISQEEYLELSETISNIIKGNTYIDVYGDYSTKSLSWECVADKIKI